ncbi:MAG: hypothetical protein ACRDO1_08865 [Nocardioidaceae bacterium]
MPDVEQLLRDTLHEYADRAPDAQTQAARAMRRARRRRRRLLAGVTLAAVAVLVPMAWAISPEDPEPVRRDPSAGELLADQGDWRWEAYGGVEVEVPASWGYGNLTQWCAPDGWPGKVDRPSVDRPGAGPLKMCSATKENGDGLDRPTYVAGLLLRPRGVGPRLGRSDVAADAPVYRKSVGEVDLTVIDVEPAVARRILSSATVIEGSDVSGCPGTTPVPRLGAYFSVRRTGLAGVSDVDSVSICRYGLVGWDRPTLEASERLGRADGEELLSALRDLPDSAEQRRPGGAQAGGSGDTEAVQLRLSSGGELTVVWVHFSGTGPHGVDDGVVLRELSTGLLRPILDPPWRGTVEDSVPWPGA